ncbi:transcription factor IIA, alpha/beta subunit-domain-containing protein [Mycena sp. CBHHK59/15]|nr:transcription factor IIA, alpha/beta subunit-domain-containing protein [Mycena sp. CBHHK59/15]
MSNKIVPSIYRTVIDDVIASIKPSFEEFGVSEDVLAELQHKWEDKVIASRVAEFEPPPQHPFPMQLMPQYAPVHHPYTPPPPPPQVAQQSQVKVEPVDNRYILNSAPYTLPPLPGPKINGARPHPGGQTSVISFPSGPPQGRVRPIPQVDGPSEDSDDSATPPPASYAPRASHPSLPQQTPSASTVPVDSEAINSDLDDSDTEDEELEDSAGANSDIVFCTYDKVARVKSKWKCILKDGMIHANGKDYLFSRCTGEFDWV